MKKYIFSKKGFTLVEVLVATSIFVIFAVGIYSGITLIFKIVLQSRLRILETSILAEQIEIVRNLPYTDVGITNSVPLGVLSQVTTTIRDGHTFSILTTVRNIDDPFDGFAPADTAPADYKLVEISTACEDCPQQIPVVLNTIVSPKRLEGASQNGSLFVQVFDKAGLSVVGANVSVTDTAKTPTLVINDVTGNDGFLRIIGTPTGTMSYNINVSKPGFSSDYTVPISANNPNPKKPPSNVASQQVTDISFQIDRTGNLGLHFMDPNCKPIGNVQFNIRGEKLIGTDPDVYKLDADLTADSNGDYSFANFEWDKYYFSAISNDYIVGGSIPALPITLDPGATQDASIILQPKSENSLLVTVTDAFTGLPLSNSTVVLTDFRHNNQTRTTGYGFINQTDWSGGSGQTDFTDESNYFADSGNIKNSSPAGDLHLRSVGSGFADSGWLESSTFDLGVAANFNNIIFNPLSQSRQAGDNPVTFQIASATSSSPGSWDYSGPDGSASTFYTATSTVIWTGHDGHRYFRYKVFLNTGDHFTQVDLADVAFTYTASCIPPGQAFFRSLLSNFEYTLDISRDGYTSQSIDAVTVNGATQLTVSLSPLGNSGGN